MQTTRLAARSLWTHKRRLVGAFIAVFLPIGTFLFVRAERNR